MSGPIASYYASVSIDVNKKSIADVDKFLKTIEKKLQNGIRSGNLKIQLGVNQTFLRKSLSEALSKIGNLKLKVGSVAVDPNAMKQLQATLNNKTFRVEVTPWIRMSTMKALLRGGSRVASQMAGKAAVGGSSGSGGASGGGGTGWRTNAQGQRHKSISGRGDPSFMEFVGMGTRTAGNRRFLDAISTRATSGFLGNGAANFAVNGISQGVLRMGGASMLGRIGIGAGLAVGGPIGGVAMGAIGAGVTAFTKAVSMAGSVIMAPFRLLGGAISTVTGGFYRLAQTILPILGAGYMINRNVQEVTAREISLTSSAKRFGTTPEAEKTFLRNMAMTEGVRYSELIKPYTGFMSGYAPSAGVDASRSMFEAFTQYGMTHGATKNSFGNAYYALQQMASMGVIQSQELNQQLAEAQGFSGVKTLVAEAYQLSQGRSGVPIDQAMKELKDAMQKGSVNTSVVFPILDQLLRREAARGLDLSRASAQSHQGRFQTKLDIGWENFTKGGGERGLSMFWQMMDGLGQWWIDNGASIGAVFSKAMEWLNLFRIAIRDVGSFLFGEGEMNDTVSFLNNLGVPMDELKVALTNIWDTFKSIFGFGEGDFMTALTSRIRAFSESLVNVMNAFNDALKGIARMVAGYQMLRSASASDWAWYAAGGSIFSDKGSNVNKGLTMIMGGGFDLVGGGTRVGFNTIDAADSIVFGEGVDRGFGKDIGDMAKQYSKSANDYASGVSGIAGMLFGGGSKKSENTTNVNLKITSDANTADVANNPSFINGVVSVITDVFRGASVYSTKN